MIIKNKFKKAFTMIEMLVVMAIFGMITAVVMFQYGEFNSQVVMTNMAYEVGMSIRQAQTYSLGVVAEGTLEDQNFKSHYGSYLNLETSVKDFIFFNDMDDGNGKCDGADGAEDCFACVLGDECKERLTLGRDIIFESICLSIADKVLDDDGKCEGDEAHKVTITFARPNPDAKITNLEKTNSKYTSAAIVLGNSYGNRRAVFIKNTGLISVEVLPDKN